MAAMITLLECLLSLLASMMTLFSKSASLLVTISRRDNDSAIMAKMMPDSAPRRDDA